MWIDRPDMTIDVDWDVKQQTKPKKDELDGLSLTLSKQTSEFLILTTFCVWAGWIKHYRVKTPEI